MGRETSKGCATVRQLCEAFLISRQAFYVARRSCELQPQPPAAAARTPRGTPVAELGLDDESLADDALVDAMIAHPILINRPLVVTPLGVKLCRPSEAVLDILPDAQRGAFAKEDGEQVIDEAGRRIS